MSLLRQFQEYIFLHHLFTSKDRLLLAVSGGLDSVVLTKLCAEGGYPFGIVHCNFQLRGEESDRDEKFVHALADGYGVPFILKRFSTEQYATENKLSIQVAARELRYAWFEELIQRKSGAEESGRQRFLVTAHHADDNLETVLMNFFKGTGIAGLRGMLPQHGSIVRPLLCASRRMIEDFAAAHSLKWVEDSSNASDKYTRNFFRHQVIPLVEEKFPGAVANLAGNIERFREIELLYKQSVSAQLRKLVERSGDEIHLPVLKLKKTAAQQTILFELLKPFLFTPAQVREVVHLLESETGKSVQSATHRIFRNRAWLILSPVQTENAAHLLIEPGDLQVQFEGGSLQFEESIVSSFPGKNSVEEILSVNKSAVGITKKTVWENNANLSADELEYPLLLRKWKAGDYFYPLGLNKKKKISRFLIDQKLSKTEKEKTWVLESNRKIIWVVGMRIDHRFRLVPGTKKLLHLILFRSDNMAKI